MIAVQVSYLLKNQVKCFFVFQTVFQTAVPLKIQTSPVPCYLSTDRLRLPPVSERQHLPVAPFNLFINRPRIPIDTEIIVFEIVCITDHDFLVFEGFRKSITEHFVNAVNPCPAVYMLRFVMRRPECGNIRIMMFTPLSYYSHFDKCDTGIIVPRLTQFLHESRHPFIEFRRKITATDRRK